MLKIILPGADKEIFDTMIAEINKNPIDENLLLKIESL
jgi:hypothetical protein